MYDVVMVYAVASVHNVRRVPIRPRHTPETSADPAISTGRRVRAEDALSPPDALILCVDFGLKTVWWLNPSNVYESCHCQFLIYPSSL